MKNSIVKILLAFSLLLVSLSAFGQCKCATCNGKGKVAVEKLIWGPIHIIPEYEPATKIVLETCPTCRGTGEYCPPPPPCTRTCTTCGGSGQESYEYLHGSGQYQGKCQRCKGSGKVSCSS